MSINYYDQFEEGYSACCGAGVILGNICMKCGEHCDIEDSFDDHDYPPEREIQKIEDAWTENDKEFEEIDNDN